MTKKDIAKAIADDLGVRQTEALEVIRMVFDNIVEALVKERRLELRNFGVFEIKKRKARKARNPRTGEPVYVPEKLVVTFAQGREMEERVRQLKGQPRERRARSTSATPLEVST